MADRDMHGKYSLELYDTGRYMRLDAAAQRALNVLKSKTDANDNFSLYGLLNRARSAMGKRLLKARQQPVMLLAGTRLSGPDRGLLYSNCTHGEPCMLAAPIQLCTVKSDLHSAIALLSDGRYATAAACTMQTHSTDVGPHPCRRCG